MKYDGRAEVCLDFLKEIAANNNREWFNDNKDKYTYARKAFESMVEELIPAIATFDESVKYLTVKDCTYRFYRDIRFSPDKSPFKRHFGAYINAKGKKAFHGGYYMHLEPDNCLIAGGAYCLPNNILKAVRESICDQPETFHGIVSERSFKSLFPIIGEEHLKTMPKGFPKDFKYPEYLKCKDYSCFTPVSNDFFNSANWLDSTTGVFKTLKPFLDFVNEAIDEVE